MASGDIDHSKHGSVVSRGPYEELSVEDGPIPSSPSTPHSIALHGGAIELFLFPNVVTTNAEEFFLACLVIILLSFLLEIGRYYASRVENKLLNSKKVAKRVAADPLDYSTFPSLTLQQPNNHHTQAQTPLHKPSRCRCASMIISESWLWILTGFGHFLTHFMSILFMLIAMTYNIYLILSLCLGATCGSEINKTDRKSPEDLNYWKLVRCHMRHEKQSHSPYKAHAMPKEKLPRVTVEFSAQLK